MAGREPDPGTGYDDWFDEPQPPQDRRRRGNRHQVDEDAWTVPEAPPRRPRREPVTIAGREVTTFQLGVAAACLVALFLAILAAAGVFSSSPPKPAPTVPTTPASVAPPPSSTGPKKTAKAVRAPTATLKPGDTGSQVATLQKELDALGYSAGKADGDYGPGTKQAVMNFQTAKGLTADGVVGPKTLAALQQAANG